MKSSFVDVMVFDSGVGGLSVLAAIHAQAPHLTYCFVGDNAGLPYGNKPEEWLIERVPYVIERALERISCRQLVVACNTASTIVLPPLRKTFSFPVIGVVPAIKPAAAISKRRVIGLLATPATIDRPYTLDLIQAFAADCDVIKIGSSRLVAIAEDLLRGHPPDRAELISILKPFAASKPDVVVLGCTHFPLLSKVFSELFPNIAWIDSGEAVAKRVLQLSESIDRDKARGGEDGNRSAYFTAQDIELSHLEPFGLSRLEFLRIDFKNP